MKNILAIISIIVFLVSCQSASNTVGMTSEKLAVLVCQCSTPIVKYNDELRVLAASDNMEALSQKMSQGDQIMEKAVSCITDQIEKDPKGIINENLLVLIDEHCHLDQRIATDLVRKVADFKLPTF